MAKPTHSAAWLCTAAAAWCVLLALVAWFGSTPLVRHRPFPELGTLFAIPAALASAAAYLAFQWRRGLFVAVVVLFAAFAVITGFAMGDAYLPALALMVWAVFVMLDNSKPGPVRGR